MGYWLALVLPAVVALVVAVVRSPRPNPRHDFIFGMVARLAPGDVVEGSFPAPAARDEKPPERTTTSSPVTIPPGRSCRLSELSFTDISLRCNRPVTTHR
jgi:hypothetical protein